MGLAEALSAYSDYNSLCPACKRKAKEAGRRILRDCHSGKHAKTKGLMVPPP